MADPPYVEPPYSTHLGVIRNKSQLYNVGIHPVKASTTLVRGMVVNFIKATGVEAAYGAIATIIKGQIGMISEGSANATTSAGGSEVQVWGSWNNRCSQSRRSNRRKCWSTNSCICTVVADEGLIQFTLRMATTEKA